MSPIRLYDTMRRAKVDFEPADPKRVTMYVCGPTVYGRAHIGNARPAVVFDVLQRLLRHTYGAKNVIYARNITDIDDKIMAAAVAEGVDPKVITDRYEAHYLADMGALGVQPPDLAPHATDHVPQMVAMIGDLIAKGAAYEAEGHVLFDVAAPGDYGRLSRRPLDEMIAGARVEVAPYKRNPADFVLWKPSADEQPGWESPWGRGRPGWHIECSAMIAAHLGHTIDIHGGGLDLIFPHHENELAQSSCAHDGAPLARVWMHNGFLSMGDTKMSKSLGNVVTVDALLEQGWSGEVLRLALLSAHYRQPLAWTEDLLTQSKATLDRWQGFVRRSDVAATEVPERVIAALADDLNTPAVVAAIARLSRLDDVGGMRAAMGLMGLLEPIPEHAEQLVLATSDATPVATTIDDLVAARTAARTGKNFAESDRIRDDLVAQGIILEDGPGGTTWRRA
ncbi:cysteine--tRNA ligase [Glacieibacterium megasporae]|uniref:cysteine--tRNA ligase n=1 Tax=Glacieibacterium megasporae TaxID=2835787 RepID=UPI002105E8D5|nr:cysteine--tRNA ligase [Polymorphobacter megasporae]